MNEEKLLKQIQDWRDSYIDISEKNNNLLNQNPQCSDAIRLLTTPACPYTFFWDMAVGKRGNLVVNFDMGDARAHEDSGRISWQPVHEYADAVDRVRLMEDIYNRGRETIIQRGENPICLTFGRFIWHIRLADVGTEATKISAARRHGRVFESNGVCYMELNTPVLFVPITFSHFGRLFSLKTIPTDANTVMVNPALMIRYEKTEGSAFPLPACGQVIEDPLDFAIEDYFAMLQRYYNIDCAVESFAFDPDYVAMDAYDYDKICMYRDLLGHERDLAANPILRGLFGEAMPMQQQQVEAIRRLDSLGSAAGIANAVAADSSFQVLDSDSSQCEAIERFKNGESFILQGPPGTGKTQTIINLIAEALVNGQKVLFVSGKMSALNTVVKKLQLMPNINIDKHCLLIMGESEEYKNNINDTYRKLQASLNAASPRLAKADYRENVDKLQAARKDLLQYNHQMYDTHNSMEMSLYDIIGRVLLLGYKSEYIHIPFSPAYLANLDRGTLHAHLQRFGVIESVLGRLLARSGKIEDDAWYGYERYEFGADDRARLSEFCRVMQARLDALQAVFALPEAPVGAIDRAVADLVGQLQAYPVATLLTLCDDDIGRDLHGLLAKDSLAVERAMVQAEQAQAPRYRAVVARVLSLLDTLPPVDAQDLAAKLAVDPAYLTMRATEVRAELAAIRGLTAAGAEGYRVINGFNLDRLQALLDTIDQYLAVAQQADEERQAILDVFQEGIFDYNYGKLLAKLRGKWAENLKANKAPFGFAGQCKQLVALCYQPNANFDIRTVADWLVKLELYKTHLAKVNDLQAKIRAVGIGDFNATVLRYLRAQVANYLRVKEQYLRDNMFGDDNYNFYAYLQDKQTQLHNIMQAGAAMGLNKDITVQQMADLAADLGTVGAENARLAADPALGAIMPHAYRGCATDWDCWLALIDLVGQIRATTRRYCDTVQDMWEVYDRISRLFGAESRALLQQVVRHYGDFYAYAAWFSRDPQYRGHHDNTAYGVADYIAWLQQVRDLGHIDDFVRYRVEVKNLEEDPYDHLFFAAFADKGRGEYPVDSLCRHYEIAVLMAYYNYLLTKATMVASLNQDELQALEGRFIEADKTALEFNRKLVDIALARDIERNTAKHAYLGATREGHNYSVRRLLKDRCESIAELAPCLMMSVYSVSKLLPYDLYRFDVVIFDEASQIPMEDALPAIMRARRQIVIAGDPQQMPAVSYFKAKLPEFDTDDEDVDLTCMSLIDFTINMPHSQLRTYNLNMHYRSNHESLINYSNQRFYGGRLVTFPSPKCRNADFGLYNYDLAAEGATIVGGRGENEAEANRVAQLIRDHFDRYPLPTDPNDVEAYNESHSLGVIVFGTHQKERLRRVMARDPMLKKVLDFGDNRVFSITTVDDIQGDEMTNMILSLTYGRDAHGRVVATWGHMNQPVAAKKFNVAVTRARDNLKFVHSVSAGDIAAYPNLGYVADYLQQFGSARPRQFVSDPARNSDFVSAIGALCASVVGEDRVVYNFGEGEHTYRVPISILSADKTHVVLGVLCEADHLAEGFSVREYTHTCKGILRARGWDNLVEANALQWLRDYNTQAEALRRTLAALDETH